MVHSHLAGRHRVAAGHPPPVGFTALHLCTGPSGALTFWQVALERMLRAGFKLQADRVSQVGLGPVLAAPAD